MRKSSISGVPPPLLEAADKPFIRTSREIKRVLAFLDRYPRTVPSIVQYDSAEWDNI